MQAVIFAAGKGTRMDPLTRDNSKLLLKVLGIPILERNLEQLNNLVDEVILVVGYRGELIQEYFGKHYKNLKITYALQKEQLGTGDAAKQALPFLLGQCLFMNGDDLYDKQDIQRILKKYPSILVAQAEHPERFAVVETKDDKVTSLVEKPEHPKGNLVSVGMYFLDSSIFQRDIEKALRGEYEFTDYVRLWLKEKDLYFVVAKEWLPISIPENIVAAERVLKMRNMDSA
ncbi:NTP transferase domain-containing protein [Patescibacteria group bacterium]|nr:NTP transferase domain-containing protein [Patescibacteria group bacterium]